MADWDCKYKTLGVNEWMQHSRIEGDKEYGISVILQDVSPAGSHKALVGVYFFGDWDKSDDMTALTPGTPKLYTDPGGAEWMVQADETLPAGADSTADMKVCFEEAAPAEGKIMSIDVPTSAKEGDSVDLCATIKNVGGVTAKFFLRFYDGTTMVRETLPGNVAAGQTIENVCELFTMPGHKWTGKIELMREV